VFQADVTKAALAPIGDFVIALIRRELQAEGLPPDTFGSMDSERVLIGKTADRSVLGCMNEMAFGARLAVSMDGGLLKCDLADLNRRLRRDMHSPRAYARPIDLAAALASREAEPS
jgi:hypothetical protein